MATLPPHPGCCLRASSWIDCQSSNCSLHFAHRYWYVGMSTRSVGVGTLGTTANATGVNAVLWLLPVAYLLGTFPTAGIVARAPVTTSAARGREPRCLERLSAGGLQRRAGRPARRHRQGIPRRRRRSRGRRAPGAYLLGFAAVLGHVFPVTQRFRGGRGVATAGGVMIVIYPLIALVSRSSGSSSRGSCARRRWRRSSARSPSRSRSRRPATPGGHRDHLGARRS